MLMFILNIELDNDQRAVETSFRFFTGRCFLPVSYLKKTLLIIIYYNN